MVFLVLLVGAAAVGVVVAVWNAIYRRRLVASIHDHGTLPGTEALPSDAAVDSGELGRGAGGLYNQSGLGGA